MKAIILAGGTGSRLFPATCVTSKHLLPIFDKPMIYYPLSTIMLAGLRDILIISSPDAINSYQKLFKTGEHLGLNFSYATQAEPKGIAQSFIIGKEFIGNDTVALILGDNIFYGHDIANVLTPVSKITYGAHIFGYTVTNPQRYGVAQVDHNNKVISIEEKPVMPKSNYAVTGLYFYDNQVIDVAKTLIPSKRGELEITDVNNYYLNQGSLTMTQLSRGYAWLDTGTHESYLEANNFIAAIEHRQGLKIGCIEEIAYMKNYISQEQMMKLAYPIRNTEYGKYLINLVHSTLDHSKITSFT